MTSPWKMDEPYIDPPRDKVAEVIEPNTADELKELIREKLTKNGKLTHGFALIMTDLPNEEGFIVMTNTSNQLHLMTMLYDYMMMNDHRDILKQVVSNHRTEELINKLNEVFNADNTSTSD